MTTLIGFIGAILTTLAFLPQTIKTIRTRSTADLSLTTYAVFFSGVIGWLLYGILLDDPVIISANVVTGMLTAVILYMIVRNRGRCTSIAHIALWAQNLEAMKQFYVTHFDALAGERYENRAKGFQSYFLRFASGAMLELMHRQDVQPASAEQRRDTFHIAISLGSRSQVIGVTERLRAHGIVIAGEPRTTGDGYFESTIIDPEGNLIELTV